MDDGWSPSSEVEDLAKGAGKSFVSGVNTTLGWLDYISDKTGVNVTSLSPTGISTPKVPGPSTLKANAEALEDKYAPGVRNPPNNADQELGGAMEMAAEFFYGEGEARTMFEALPFSEKVAKLAKATKFLEEHPAIAKTVAAGILAGGVGTGQAAFHGADTNTALTTGAITGGISAGLVGIPAAISYVISKFRPVTEDIAGVTVPERVGQASAASKQTAKPATTQNGSATRATQQAAVPQVIGNLARRSLANSLEDVNAGRAASRITNPAQMLPAPEDAQPFTFEIGTGPTKEVREGNVSQPAARLPQKNITGGTTPKNEAELGSTAYTIPGSVQRTAFMTSAEPGNVAGETTATGGGTYKTSDPAQAELILSRMKQVEDSADFTKLPKAQQALLRESRESLQQQVDMFHAWRETQPHFAPLNTDDIVGQVNNFGEVRDQLQASAKPIAQKLERLSADPEGGGNEFSRLQSARARAFRNNDYDGVREAENGIQNLIEKNKNFMSTDEYRNFNRLWSQSKIAEKLQWATDGTANASERFAQQKQAGRLFDGKQMTQRLNKIEEEYGAKRLDDFLGTNGMDNLHRMADLVSNPTTESETRDALSQVAVALYHRAGKGALAGGLLGHLGGHAFMGVEIGVATESSLRSLYEYASTSPRIGSLLDYAVRNKVNPKIYVPLIAGEIERENTQPKQGATQ